MAEKALSTRRQFLKAAPPALALAAVPAVAAAERMDAQQRYDFHLAEFQKAAEELHPRIHWWKVHHIDGSGMMLSILAEYQHGAYEGDGWYYHRHSGRKFVRRAPERDCDGQRWFSIECPHSNRRYLSERELQASVYGLVERLDREGEACL
jgi:hypothetical protein